MIKQDSELASLLQRLEKLERAVRDLTRPRVVEATEVRLSDSGGATRAVLAVGDVGPFITYPDPHGNVCTELLASADWRDPSQQNFDPARTLLWSEK